MCRYTGWLKTAGAAEEKGKQFDSTQGRGPFKTPIGVGRVIKGTQITYSPTPAFFAFTLGYRAWLTSGNNRIGWDEGVVTMKLGEKARLDISSDFAYGTQEFPGLIPPNSDLILYVPHIMGY